MLLNEKDALIPVIAEVLERMAMNNDAQSVACDAYTMNQETDIVKHDTTARRRGDYSEFGQIL